MNYLIDSNIIENIGWTLLHSVWQIALVALVLFFLLNILRGYSANVRYFAAVSALVCAALFPALTFYGLNEKTPAFVKNTEISTARNSELPVKPYFTGEDSAFVISNKNEPVKSNSPGFLASFENLRENISKSLPTILPLLVVFWLFGIMIFSLRLIGGVWQLHIFKTRKISAPDAKWREKFRELCEKLEIRQSVKLLKSDFVETPVVIGFLKPVVLIPASVFLNISQRELETIIAHELVHVRRYDALVNFGQSFVEILFFYHPCVWWISGVIRKEREFVADEAVVKVLENSRIMYANALANLEELRLTANRKSIPLATAANGGDLMQRISKILQKNSGIKGGKTVSLWSAVLAFLLVSAVFIGLFSFNTNAFVSRDGKMKNKKLAVGFVSIPANRASEADKSFDETPRLLIENLNKYEVPAVGFFQVLKDFDDENALSEKAETMKMWSDAGLEVGIGAIKRNGYYDKQFDEYAGGIDDTIELTKRVSSSQSIIPRYFIYPHLNRHITDEDIERCEARLKLYNLSTVKYSIENQELMFSGLYELARKANDSGKMLEIQTEFIKYMTEMFEHYENISQEVFGRNINQTLILTPSRLVADSADQLFEMLEKRGYEFVSMDEAQSDIAYQTPENFAGVNPGIAWFERWQAAKGKTSAGDSRESGSVQMELRNRKAVEIIQKTLDIIKTLPLPDKTPPDAPPPPKPPKAPPAPPKDADLSEPETAPQPPVPPNAPEPPKPPRS